MPLLEDSDCDGFIGEEDCNDEYFDLLSKTKDSDCDGISSL